MSAIATAKRLAETRLSTITPSIPTAYENAGFSAPSTKYLRCNFGIKPPSDPCVGGSYYRENLTFFVYVCDKLNIGSGGAIATAEAVRGLFHKGLSLSEGNVKVRVLETPHIAGGVITSDRYVVPVSIKLFVESL